MPLLLSAPGSHLYPGARGTVQGDPAEGPCLIEFADGSAALGQLTGTDPVTLDLGAYVTARGTGIPSRRWALALDRAAFRVTARLQSPCG